MLVSYLQNRGVFSLYNKSGFQDVKDASSTSDDTDIFWHIGKLFMSLCVKHVSNTGMWLHWLFSPFLTFHVRNSTAIVIGTYKTRVVRTLFWQF